MFDYSAAALFGYYLRLQGILMTVYRARGVAFWWESFGRSKVSLMNYWMTLLGEDIISYPLE